ncbi:MAG TPA: cytochrome c oxidase subunit 3 [Pyrinomonadaceae bacterium]|nr:cytochrome c oxidase subunit 3 [Pyrinomonadaceae bacterium]
MVGKVQEGIGSETVEAVGERVFEATPARPRGGRGPRGGGGGPNNGGPGGGGGGDRDNDKAQEWSPDKYRFGVYFGIVSILVMFAALAFAYVLRLQAVAPSIRPRFEPPDLLWLSTALIVTSSLTFIAAKYHLRRGAASAYWGWLGVTLLLGLGFVLSQAVAWRQLSAQAFFLPSNPHSTFFYVLTALHGLHLLGGLAALSALLIYARRRSAHAAGRPKTLAFTDSVGVYWHFMDLLWLGIFALLLFEG